MPEEKRTVGDYEVIACQRIGGEEIIVGENRNAVPAERYLCCYVERNEITELRIASAAKNAIEQTDKEKKFIGDGDRIITADKCQPITYGSYGKSGGQSKNRPHF